MMRRGILAKQRLRVQRSRPVIVIRPEYRTDENRNEREYERVHERIFPDELSAPDNLDFGRQPSTSLSS